MKLKTDDLIKITYSAVKSIIEPGKSNSPLPKKESPNRPEIYLFRHGESKDNFLRVFSGWRDSRLTTLGKKQAQELASKLKNKQIDVCITSSLSRSKETARIALKSKKVKYEVDDRIIERNYGDLTGKNKVKLMKKDLIGAVKYRRFYDFPPPNGESLKDVQKRVFPFCQDLVKRIRKTGENIAISAHGNSMKIARLYFEKLSIGEVLVQENPLARDYAEYVVAPKKILVKRSG
ncbi:MAG: histidine phosphatase family protein [Candidatus Shapirobacteria bacterium]